MASLYDRPERRVAIPPARQPLTRHAEGMPFVVAPIPAEVVAQLLVRDDAGNAPRLVVEDEGGSPLRCCLRPTRPGEDVALVSYAPLRRWAASNAVDAGPYDETGPVFVHAAGCEGYADSGYPPALRDAPRMLRAYGRDGRILRAVQVPPYGAFDRELEALLDDAAVAVVHARAVEFGCFTFEAHR
jgi:hypothetical protein